MTSLTHHKNIDKQKQLHPHAFQFLLFLSGLPLLFDKIWFNLCCIFILPFFYKYFNYPIFFISPPKIS